MTATLRLARYERGAHSASVIAQQSVCRAMAPRSRIEASAPVLRRFRFDLADGAIEIEVVKDDEPDWLYSVLTNIQELSFLPEGWDSFGGRPLAFDAAFSALDLMATIPPPNATPPSIVPGSRGGMQMEWHRQAADFEVSIEVDGRITAAYSGPGGVEWEMLSGALDAAKLHAAAAAVSAPN